MANCKSEDSMTELLPKCVECGVDISTFVKLFSQQWKNLMWKTKKENNKQFSSIRSFSLFSVGFLSIIVIALFVIPIATSQKLASGRSTSLDSVIGSKNNYLNSIASYRNLPIYPKLNHQQHQDLSKALRTRRKAKRENKRKLQECPKDFRSYCLNGGKCRWILSLEKASCRCPTGWRGGRCEELAIDLTSKNNSEKSNISAMIAIVLGTCALLFIFMLICICWSRCRSVQKDLKDDLEMERQNILSDRRSASSFSNGSLR